MSATAESMPAETYISTDQLCTRLQISKSTAERWRLTSEGVPFIKLGKGRTCRVIYRVSDLEAWLAANTFTSTSAAKAR